MKRSRWVSLLLACPAKPFLGVVVAATAVLFGQRADAMRTPLTDLRAAITQPQQLTAPVTDVATPADAPNQVWDASTWLVESITPLGHTDDGQPLVLISLLIPTAHLAEHTPASTRAGPYAAPKPSSPRLRSPRTHTRVFYIGQPPLGLCSACVDLESASKFLDLRVKSIARIRRRLNDDVIEDPSLGKNDRIRGLFLGGIAGSQTLSVALDSTEFVRSLRGGSSYIFMDGPQMGALWDLPVNMTCVGISALSMAISTWDFAGDLGRSDYYGASLSGASTALGVATTVYGIGAIVAAEGLSSLSGFAAFASAGSAVVPPVAIAGSIILGGEALYATSQSLCSFFAPHYLANTPPK
jgi:hypothetical protein